MPPITLATPSGRYLSFALATTMTTMPEHLRQTLTWDRGKELSPHAQLTIETGIAVYFADSHSPWQPLPTRTTTAYCANTFPRAPTCPAGAPRRCRPSKQHSMEGPAKFSAGNPAEAFDAHLQCSTKVVLLPPVQPGQCRSKKVSGC